jgi:NitT/TauT family transport system substrate-binding protein
MVTRPGHIGRVVVVAILALALLGTTALAQQPRIKIKVGFPSVADVFDVPTMLAGERLRAQGYELEALFFAQEVLVLQAVQRGDVEVGTGASRATLAAIQAGADLKLIGTQHRNGWTMYSKREITRCEDLNGKRLALHSQAGISTAIVRGWLKEKCPQATPSILYIPGSENRAAALLANQIDATPLELSDAIQVDALRPGAFVRMADFSKDLPWLIDSMFYAAPKTIGARRDLLKALMRELIQIHRLAQRDPSTIAAVVPKYVKLQDVSLMPQIARAYSEANLWPTDGGFTPPAVDRTIKFFVDIESIKPGLKAETVGDYTIMSEVMRDMK